MGSGVSEEKGAVTCLRRGSRWRRRRMRLLERGRDRLRVTGSSWMAVGPGAAVALSARPLATALPGSELQALLPQPLIRQEI